MRRVRDRHPYFAPSRSRAVSRPSTRPPQRARDIRDVSRPMGASGVRSGTPERLSAASLESPRDTAEHATPAPRGPSVTPQNSPQATARPGCSHQAKEWLPEQGGVANTVGEREAGVRNPGRSRRLEQDRPSAPTAFVPAVRAPDRISPDGPQIASAERSDSTGASTTHWWSLRTRRSSTPRSSSG